MGQSNFFGFEQLLERLLEELLKVLAHGPCFAGPEGHFEQVRLLFRRVTVRQTRQQVVLTDEDDFSGLKNKR